LNQSICFACEPQVEDHCFILLYFKTWFKLFFRFN